MNNSVKDVLLEKIIKYYLESSNFNGIPKYKLDKHEIEACKELIIENEIEIYSDTFVPNPHIKSRPLSLKLDKDKFIEEIDKSEHVVFYPTTTALLDVPISEEKPFTLLLKRGRCQLEILFFKQEVLEAYFQDPRYTVDSHDYRGNIDPKENFYDELAGEWLRDFGLAYHNDKSNKIRAIGVFIGDLSKMSLNAQLRWKISLLSNQQDYGMNPNFLKNTIYAEWVDDVSIYDAILDEIKLINKMCFEMKIPELFKTEFESHSSDKPEDFRIISLSTLKNYYAFVTALEKMFVDNINYKTFLSDSSIIKSVQRMAPDGSLKGSLVLFEEWLKKNIRTKNDITSQIIKPLKNIRKLRQNPAHKIYDNTFDLEVYKMQDEIIKETYSAISTIRLYFMNHPACKDIEIPTYLIDGDKIIVY